MSKPQNGQELHEARRRASLSRKHFRGGRPKGWKKRDARALSQTVAVDPLDLGVFKGYAALLKMTVKDVFNVLAACLVLGTREGFPARPQLAPLGWRYRGKK